MKLILLSRGNKRKQKMVTVHPEKRMISAPGELKTGSGNFNLISKIPAKHI